MIRFLGGDCREILKTLPDKSVQSVVTSPPYFGLRDYGVGGQIGLESTPALYIAEMVAVFREVSRVLRDDGTVWLNLGDSYANDTKWGGSSGGKHAAGLHGNTGIGRGKKVTGFKPKDLMMIPARVAIALCDDGWYLRKDVIWAKPNPMPESCEDRPTSSHEHVFLLTKRPRYFYDAVAVQEEGIVPAGTLGAMGSEERSSQPGVNSRPPEYKVYTGTRNLRDVWTIATRPYPDAHFAVMPAELAETCIKAGTSEKGACPVCGTPWARIVQKTRTRDGQPLAGSFNTGDGHKIGASGVGHWRDATKSETTGWCQTCDCPPADPRPCVVLDPFSGAGTTALVADRLGRDAIGIDLNSTYGEMARDRLIKDAGMFAVFG